MGLDYSKGCVNFRDVGECLNLLANKTILPPGRLLRGGKLEFVATARQIGNPGTIINLRKGLDAPEQLFAADHWHFPISNDYEKYNTSDSHVRRWLNDVLRCVAEDVVRLPILFHCTSGKDRTGVAIAAILRILDVDRELIVQEYLWSDGEVSREQIVRSLDGMGDPRSYFHRVQFETLQKKLLQT